MKNGAVSNPELPEGWTLVTLRDVTREVPNVKPEAEPDRLFGYVDISSICNTTNRIGEHKMFRGIEAPSRARRPIQTADVLFSNVRTYLRNVAIVEPSAEVDLCSTGFTVLRSNGAIDPHFLFRYVLTDQFINAVTPQQTGTHYPATTDRVVLGQPMPLAPLAEQRRIVVKVEALLARVQATRDRLAAVPTIISRFRQSILAAACNGRLTEDWRQNNPANEPADRLVPEKRFQLAESYGDLLDLPETWRWVPLGNYARCSRGRFLVRPRNDPSYFNGPYPFIQIGNLPSEGGWVTAHSQTLNEKGLKVSKMFPRGTVAIAIVGATIGNTGLLGYDMCFTDSMVGIETGTLEGNQFVEFFLRHRKEAIRESSYSSGGQPNIKLEVLNPYPLALPPLAEQREIVRRVESLFKLVDAIDRRVASARKRADKLAQAILAKAFRGELVPTEADLARAEGRDYETAEQLLTRIRAENAANETQPKPKRKSTMSKKASKSVPSLRPLVDVLRDFGKPMAAEDLMSSAGYSDDTIEEFYQALRDGVRKGSIRDPRETKNRITLAKVGK